MAPIHFRIILEAAEVDSWVADSHLNVNGAASAEKNQVQALFSSSEPDVIEKIVRRHYPDFKLCGYLDTLEEFETLLKKETS